MSKRSVLDPGFAVGVAEVASCASELVPSPKCETASGAIAAPFTKPRLVMFFMVVSHLRLNSGFLYYFRNARSKIFEHHRGGLAARAASDRTPRMSRRARLIKARDGHAVLRPTGHRSHGAALRQARAAGVATTVPVVRIHALQIERTFDRARENFVICQICSEALQVFQIGVGNSLFDGVPVLQAFFQRIRLVGHHFYRMHPGRRAR